MKHAVHIRKRCYLLYSWKGFHKCPHGTAKIEDAKKYENSIKYNGNGFNGGTVTNFCHDKHTHTKEKIVRVAYPGSAEISEFNNLNVKEHMWLEFVLQEGLLINKRDSCGQDGISARIRFGYTQKQSYSSLFGYMGKKFQMPYRSFPSFCNRRGKSTFLPLTLREEFAKIISLSQSKMESLYVDQNIMTNKKQTAIFGLPFGKAFHDSCTSKFEYAEIFVETESLVIRHLDYQNDFRKNYDYGTSYSFITRRRIDGKVYRVNFLMCTRKLCGDFMDEIHH